MSSKSAKPLILTVGGGNSENILSVEDNIVFGNKHLAEVTGLVGGSAVNYSMRLLCAGFDVFPILTIGDDDIGRKIEYAFSCLIKANQSNERVVEFIQSKDKNSNFLDPNIQTSNTTILIHGSTRTIFTQKLRGGKYFLKQLIKRVKFAEELSEAAPDMVMIGHIQSDSRDINPLNCGENTKYLIERFHNDSQIFCNFGASQINLGYDFWKNDIPRVDVFQLNLEEAKRFFSNGADKKSLQEIVNIIHQLNVNAVITLDRFGALGIHKERHNSFVLAWPIIDVKEVVDPTGAGDAFAAGVVAQLCDKPNFGLDEFKMSIRTGRLWAAVACKTIGGVGDCPSAEELEDFDQWLVEKGAREVEIRESEHAMEIMSLLDIAFQ